MKRGCLIVLIAVPLLILAAAAYAYYSVKSSYGLSPAEPVSHETLASGETRLRVVLSRDKLVPYLQGLLPAGGVQAPWYVSTLLGDPTKVLEEVLPYEIALLGNADYKGNVFDFTLFVNERIAGPAIATVVRQQLDQMQKAARANTADPAGEVFRTLKFQEGFIDNEQRGVLKSTVGLPMPAGMQNRVLRSWQVDKSPTTQTIAGGNLLEVVIDNKTGELMTLAGVIGKANNQTLDQVFSVPDVELAIRSIDVVRATLNLTGDDELTAVFRVALNTDDFMARMKILAAFTVGFEGLASFGQPDAFAGVKGELAKLGLTADYANGQKPVYDGNTLVASFVVTGFRPLLQQQVDAVLAQLASMQ